MTFYASFWDALNGLPKKDQLPVFRAVVSYGLYGEHNETLSTSQNAFFALMRPVLDASRKKAANGKHGGSKPKANGKQDESEKEKENENENEIENEIEYECKKELAFDKFWEAYPRKVGKAKAEAAFLKVTVGIDVLLAAIEQQKKSAQWQKEDGQFIPHPATWLNGKRWEDQLDCTQEQDRNAKYLDDETLLAIRRMMQEDNT